MKLIAEGAEAKIYSADGLIVKERTPKKYRLPEIDEKLRKTRTRREAKILQTMQEAGIRVPKLISYSDKLMKIELEQIKGQLLKDALNSQNCGKFGKEIGRIAAAMHNLHIIHADLTTSNVIATPSGLCIIDFGLSFVSYRAEDKAVDLHLLKQALKSQHAEIAQKCLHSVLEEYRKQNQGAAEVLSRLEKVDARGRYKGKTMWGQD